MSKKSDIVFHGYLNLSPSEQQEVRDEIEDYHNSSQESQKSIKRANEDTFQRITLGPIGTGCPCCGR